MPISAARSLCRFGDTFWNRSLGLELRPSVGRRHVRYVDKNPFPVNRRAIVVKDVLAMAAIEVNVSGDAADEGNRGDGFRVHAGMVGFTSVRARDEMALTSKP